MSWFWIQTNSKSVASDFTPIQRQIGNSSNKDSVKKRAGTSQRDIGTPGGPTRWPAATRSWTQRPPLAVGQTQLPARRQRLSVIPLAQSCSSALAPPWRATPVEHRQHDHIHHHHHHNGTGKPAQYTRARETTQWTSRMDPRARWFEAKGFIGLWRRRGSPANQNEHGKEEHEEHIKTPATSLDTK